MSDDTDGVVKLASGIYLPKPEGYRATTIAFDWPGGSFNVDMPDAVELAALLDKAIEDNVPYLALYEPYYHEVCTLTRYGIRHAVHVSPTFIPHENIRAQAEANKRAAEEATNDTSGRIAVPGGTLPLFPANRDQRQRRRRG